MQCRWCGAIFCICQSCWRGQVYCCNECRRAAQCKAHREAQRKYRKTEKGKKAHRESENCRRMGLTKQNKKIVDDTASKLLWSSIKIEMPAKLSDEGQVGCGETTSMRTGRCHFCGSWGVIVDQFPRRDYGKRSYGMTWSFVVPRKG